MYLFAIRNTSLLTKQLPPIPANVEVLDAAGRAAFNPPPARITQEFLRFVCEAIIQGRADDWQDRVSTTPPEAPVTKGQKSKKRSRT